MTEPGTSYENQKVIKLKSHKELCSWMDNSALRRCALLDSYLSSAITPSGRYVYFNYASYILVFNVYCGTTTEFTTSQELISFLPTDDNAGYMLLIDGTCLSVQRVVLDFATGFFSEISEKRVLLTDCEKVKYIDNISFLMHASQLIIVYLSTLGSTSNFCCFSTETWDEITRVEQFGTGDFCRFPFYQAPYAYAFQNRQLLTIKRSAESFGKICEVNPRIANTIPIAARADRPQQNRQMQDVQAAQQQFLIGQIRQRIQQQRQLIFQADADIDLFEFEQEQPPPQAPPVPLNANQQVGLPLRHRIIPLVNDLTCVGIPEKVLNLPNVAEKFEFEWRDDRFYLLWSFGVQQRQLNEMNYHQMHTKFDYDLLSGFFNFMAVFNLNNLTWYPIQIEGFSPRTDSPLLAYVCEGDFLTVINSQFSQPFRWCNTRNAPPTQFSRTHKSILNSDAGTSFKSHVYRFPMKQPDTLLNLAQAQFNRMYPNWTTMTNEQMEQQFGRVSLVLQNQKFYNAKNELLQLYIDIHMMRSSVSKRKPKPPFF